MSDLLPPNATPQERALSLAVARSIPVPNKTLWSAETCPAEMLPYLAWALSVDAWDPQASEASKRAIIAGSVDLHRRKGTPGALRRALQGLGYEVEIDEKTGTAYTFKLRFKIGDGDSAGGAVKEAELARVTSIALRQKNARSELIGTSVYAETDNSTKYAGAVTIAGAHCEIKTPPAALPLDGYAENLGASFWTVRMSSLYSGPIGVVKRDADSATLQYYSVAQLTNWLAETGGTWEYLALFSQGARHIKIKPLDSAPGDFDGNGLPYITGNAEFTGTFPATFCGAGMTAAGVYGSSDAGGSTRLITFRSNGDIADPEAPTLAYLWGGNLLPFPLTSYSFIGGLEFGYAGATATESLTLPVIGARRAIVARASPGDHEVTTGGATVAEAYEYRPMMIHGLSILGSEVDGIDSVAAEQFYGAAFWTSNLGHDALDELHANLTSKFDL